MSSERITEPHTPSDPEPAADPATLALPATAGAPADTHAERIGPYRLIRTLGEGGMGAVYLAEQQNPRRPVALKVIRPGRMSEPLVQRFRLESQILAWLQHPAVAQVYEAGEFDSRAGIQPYYAMEYVEGETLTRFAAGHGLGVRERLELFAAVCDGVEAAHQRGIIHRDLKPANILVTPDGRPKILDFGIARVTDPEAPTDQTAVGQVVGTLNYMSPEQAAGDPAAVDTRTDVYALGVILYELLAGRLPLDLKGLPPALAVFEITEATPPPLAAVDRRFRGDLSAIAGKALAKRPADRYPSAAALAADVRRHLADRPIEARAPGAWGVLWKLARRNRAAAAGVAVAAVAVLAGSGFATYGLFRAKHEAGRANQEAQAASEARADAVVQLADRTFAEARLLHARGEYEKALAGYGRAAELGYPDEVEVRLHQAKCLAGLGRSAECVRVLDEVAARPDLGRREGELLLYRGELGLVQGKAFAGDPVGLIRTAQEKGLPPPLAAYARGLLAPTLPEMVDHLQESVRLSPAESDAHAMLLGALILLGRNAEAERVAAQLRVLNPNSQISVVAEAMTAARRGDVRSRDAALAEVARRWPESADVAAVAADLLATFGRNDFLWETAQTDPATLAARVGTAVGKLQSRVAGRDAGAFAQMQWFNLPAFRPLGEAVRDLPLLMLAGNHKAVAEKLDPVARAWPTGVILFTRARFLELSGDRPAAIPLYKRAMETPSLIECRHVALAFYVHDLWAANRVGDTLAPRDTVRPELLARVRELAALGPVPDDEMAYTLGTVGIMCGDPAAASVITRNFTAKADTSYDALKFRANIDLSVGAYGRALDQANEMVRRDPKRQVGHDMKRAAVNGIQKLNAKLAAPPRDPSIPPATDP